MKKTIVLIILMLMIGSSIAVVHSKTNGKITVKPIQKNVYQGTTDVVLWDNGMHHDSLAASQYDQSISYDCYQGDDCKFSTTQGFTKVKWIGGYWGTYYKTGSSYWAISFYRAVGGQGPDGHPYTPSYAGPYTFHWDDIEKTVIQDTGNEIYYELTATLPEKIYFGQNSKFYISIWAIGQFPPQAGWAYHYSYKENPCFWGSNYFNYQFWTPGNTILGSHHDMCFQLIYENIGDLDCIGDLSWHDVEEGSWQVGSFQIKNCDTINSYLDWQIVDWPTWGGWTFNPSYGTSLHSGSTHTVVVNAKAPEERNKEFSGEIKVINSNNPQDYDIVTIYLSTPKTKKPDSIQTKNPVLNWGIHLLHQFKNK